MSLDSSPVPNGGTIDDLLPHFAYPEELPSLADTARLFLRWDEAYGVSDSSSRKTDSMAVCDAIFPLLDALECVLGKEPYEVDPALLRWPRLVDLAYEAVNFPAAAVEVWREVRSLPRGDLYEMLRGSWVASRRRS